MLCDRQLISVRPRAPLCSRWMLGAQVQLTLPSRALHLTAADTAACAAAAGQWSTALVTLMAEYRRSIYFPECAALHRHIRRKTVVTFDVP